MATEELERAKKRRSILRRNFTTTANQLRALFKEEPDMEQLKNSYEVLVQKYDVLSKCQAELVEVHINLGFDEEIIWKDVEEGNKYDELWTELKNKYISIEQEYNRSVCNKFIGKSQRLDDLESEFDGGKKKHFRYPKIEFTKFDGDPLNWISFWGQFLNIDKDESLDDYQKFQYLIQSTEKKARELVSSFPPSAENYTKALDHLKERFGREEMIIEVYVRDLLKLVLTQFQGDSDMSTCNLYDKLTTQIRALETLGVTSEKYAAMLYPLVESALPVDILRAFERTAQDGKGNKLNKLLEFLKREVESIQKIDMARSAFQTSEKINTAECIPTAAALVSSDTKNENQPMCLLCDKLTHHTSDCTQVTKLSLEEKTSIISKKKVCFLCLRGNHLVKFCKSPVRCLICQRRHNTILCNELGNRKQEKQIKKDKKNNKEGGSNSKPREDIESTSMSVSNSEKPVTLLQTLVVKITNNKREIKVRALIDNGSQRSYIRKDIAAKLGLVQKGEEFLAHSVFGGVESSRRLHKLYEVTVKNVENEVELNMMVLDEVKICGYIPRVNYKQFEEALTRHNIIMTDLGEVEDEIGLLIGADYAGLLMTGIHIKVGDLMAVKTILGWTVLGAVKSRGIKTHTLMSLVELEITDLWKLEAIGIHDSPIDANADQVLLNFENSISINEDGRYQTPLPWKEGHQEVLTNRELAYKRLLSTTKRLNATNSFKRYHEAFKEWEEMSIIKRISDDDDKGHYLAHHAIIKNEPNATTKVRPVFDGSARDKNGISLNGCLEKGENFLETIPALLTQFRTNAIAITSDIRKAFLQISVDPEDRKYLKFLWWKNEKQKELMTYQHCRVVFGLTCSPFLLAATLNHHLINCQKNKIETAEKLRKSFYVDNCVLSVHDDDEAERFINESKEIMEAGKFDLRGWIAVPSEKYKPTVDQKYTSILGVAWNTEADTLGWFSDSYPTEIGALTKRVLLSIAQKVFDPIGFTAPVTLIPKVMLQKCWMKDYNWDEELPDEMVKEFESWFSSLHLLKDCSVPRRLSEFPLRECQVSLHVFSDASQTAYATCIYLRSECSDKVSVRLVMAKTRVAPTKQKITIPRLELLAATIAVRLTDNVKMSMGLECQTYYWTDSSVVLTWIRKDAQWAIFVGNRVKEIRKLSKPCQWNHLPGTLNPADVPSRGCDAQTLINLRWWDGPEWLYKKESKWPKSILVKDDPIVNGLAEKELLKSAVYLDSVNQFSYELLYFSQYPKIVRLVAWIKRFIYNCGNKVRRSSTDITSDEYQEAETNLIKILQRDCVSEKLNIETVTDSMGIIRVKSRLTQSLSERKDFIYPILMFRHPLTERLIAHVHKTLQHAGVTILMGNLRQEYWVVGCRRLARSVVKNCGRCRRFNAKPAQTEPVHLPLKHINYSANVFDTTGIDLAGPLYLVSNKKAYIVLFTCAVYRAIHLELITSLTTDDFMMALRRFIARRGRPSTIYTDNGTNFVGAEGRLSRIDWQQIEKISSVKKIKWIFSPPSAPWWGGWWERMVRTVKDLLRRVLGKSTLNYEELQTILCDVESTINKRPLTYVSEEESLVPLTPEVFLRGFYATDENFDIDSIDKERFNTKYRKMQGLRESLRERFRNEYISMLMQKRSKKEPTNLKPGDVVLVETDGKRTLWPLGLIIEIYPGRDGRSRVAKVKTTNGEKLRPYQRLYPLEICADSKEVINNPKTTRCGRSIRIPERLLL